MRQSRRGDPHRRQALQKKEFKHAVNSSFLISKVERHDNKPSTRLEQATLVVKAYCTVEIKARLSLAMKAEVIDHLKTKITAVQPGAAVQRFRELDDMVKPPTVCPRRNATGGGANGNPR